MTRTTRIIGFSVPPETHTKIQNAMKAENKTRSELLRSMIDSYTKVHIGDSKVVNLPPDETELASILKVYWQARSLQTEKVLIIGLGIIERPDGKILIGLRNGKDKWIRNLTWVFPGGTMNSLDFQNELKAQVKMETGCEVDVKSLVESRIHPDSGFKDVQIVALYFHCVLRKESKFRKGNLVKLKWVSPMDVFKYFTGSTSDNVTKFLATLERSKLVA